MDSEHSVTRLFADLKGGDEEAADALVRRYLDALVHKAQATYFRKFDNVPRPVEDEEDAALSALDSFLGGIRAGRFPQLRDRIGLWPLLVKITVRKVYDQRERALAKKRGGGKVAQTRPDSVEQLIDGLPGPQAAAELADTYRAAMESLENPELRRIAELHLDGRTKEEIAAELGVTERTIYRKLEVIHEQWDRCFADVREATSGDPGKSERSP